MNTTRNLFYNYIKSFNFKYNESEPLIFKGDRFEEELKNILKSKEEFINLKDLIINNPHYPIFVYAAKLYSSDFLELFNSADDTYSFQNSIACTLVADMIYLNTTDVNIIPDMQNDFFLVDDNHRKFINPTIKLKNRFLAMQYYNPTIATSIYNRSKAYFDLYKKELNILQNAPLEDMPILFRTLQTYHSKKYILCEYLFDMTLNLKENAETFFSVLDTIEIFIAENNLEENFKDDITHIRIAYNYRNK
ncbi:MAG: hypothetical protein ACRCW0_08050 [Clostridium sp.]